MTSQRDKDTHTGLAHFDDDDDEAYIRAIGDFKPGAIKKIWLQHFMTHSELVFEAGPRLNMVIGANGTGKSTVLNAICLGLGGDPKLLGRADDLRAFIQHGQQIATVEIHLQPHPNQPAHVIRRVLDANKGSQSKNSRGRGSSTFFINGEKVSAQQVKDLVHGTYNITIENLCTFLPQDKVGDFSGFSDQQRLLETEKTLCGGGESYFQIHQELIEAEREVHDSAGNVETVRDQLEKFQHERDQLQREKDRMEERQRAMEQLELYRKKKLWLEVEDFRSEAVAAKESRSQLRQQVREAKTTLQPLDDKITRASSAAKTYEAQLRQCNELVRNIDKEMEKQTTKYRDHDDNIDSISLELASYSTSRARKQEARDKAAEKLQSLREMAANNPSEEVIQNEYREAQQAARDARQAYDVSKRETRHEQQKMKELDDNAQRHKKRLAGLQDEAKQRKERILRENSNLAKMETYLKDHRNEFRRPVWGPIACEINLKSANAAAFLECHVSNKILTAYVVETAEDYKKLYGVAKEMKLQVNVIKVQNGTLKPINRLYSEQKMKVLKEQHGVIGYMDESFTAPDPVLQALRDYGSVHRVLVGTEQTQRDIDGKDLIGYLNSPDPHARDPTKKNNACIFASEGDKSFRHLSNKSRYGSYFGLTTDEIRPAHMLKHGTNARSKNDVEDKLKAAHEEMNQLRPILHAAQKKTADLESESQEASVKYQHCSKQMESLKKFKSKIQRAELHLQQAEDDLAKDDRPEQKRHLRALMSRMSNSIAALEVHKKSHKERMKATIAFAAATLGKTRASAVLRQASDALAEASQNFDQLAQQARLAEQRFGQLKRQLTEAKALATREAPLQDNQGNDLPLKAQLEELDVCSVAEAQAALEDAEQVVNSIRANDSVFQQYEDLDRQCQEIEAQLTQLTSSKENKLKIISDKRKPWETALNNYVAKVDAKFSHYMGEMGCTGEVKLKTGDVDENSETLANFKDWGIQILVSYREGTKAQILSANRHSGGERSVATILYLMALQDLMVAPFRCVDEINQGLDERNERLVFKRIVANSTAPPRRNPTDHSGQYFLITPKLLPNLTDMENEGVKIQLVVNGAYGFDKPTDWNVKNMLRGMSKRPRDDDDEPEEGIASENSENGISRRRRKNRKSS